MDTTIPATTDTLPSVEFRYPEGSDTIWTATETGFYATLWNRSSDHPKARIMRAFKTAAEITRFWQKNPGWSNKNVFWLGGPFHQNNLLGPYDTPEEARRALKLYGVMLALGPYPHAVFEEPDGTTMPLGQWVNLPD